MPSCSPRELGTKLSQSSTDLIATGGQDGGNTTSYSQRAMETETVDVVVNLNASHGQGETTPLGTPIAMEAKMIVSDDDFNAGNTTLSAPSAMETVNVESSRGLNARHGEGCEQDETIKLGTPSEMETKMIVLSEDLAVGKTSLSTLSAIEIVTVESSGDMIAGKTTSGTTPRVEEMELVDAGGDSIAEQNQWTLSQSSMDLIATGGQDGGNTTSYSQRAMETETVDVVVNLTASHGQGETTPLGTPIAMEAKMIVSDEDFTAGNTTLSAPSAMETVNVESSGGLNARHGEGCEQDETIKLGTPSEMETKMIVLSEDLAVGKTSLSTLSAIEIVTVESSGDMIAGKTTSGTTPRVVEMELVDAGGDSIAEQNQDHGQDNETKFSISREKETETVVFRADLMGTLKPIFGKGGNRTSGTPRAVKNKMAKTNVESITRCKRVCERGVIEKGPSSPEGKATDKKRESPFPERASSSKRGARRGMQGTLNQPTQKRARIQEKNNEICDPGPRSIMEEGPSSLPERQATNNKRGSLWLERVRSCTRGTKRGMQDTSSQPTQKRVRIVEQNQEVNNPGPSSIMENSPSSLERQAANKKRGSPSSDRVRSCKKTTFLWLIDSKIIKEDERVSYRSDTIEKPLAGRITRGGILCSCCQEEISMWTFENHAGSTLRQPYKHIYIHRKRKTLRKCLIDVWQHAREQKRRQMFLFVPKETDADQDDDVCAVCGDGGDLICCDRCPSTYHLSCINIETVPQNDWFCPYCVCKYCGLVVDLVVEKKRYYEKKEGFKCSQCDKKYHWECFEKYEKDSSKLTKPSRSYCGRGCQGIYAKMGVYLGIRNDYSAKYSWRVIRLMETYKNNPAYMNLFLENNSKVALTWMLMNEAFEKITDRKTGINVVRSIVYSCKSNLSRIDFSRFYMFVLEEDDAIIAAASIRFHGSRIAEMPLIATEMTRRGQGVCQELMRVIESFLCNLKVKNLIIPSAVETCDMWKRKYNFTEVSEELKKEISSYKIVMFPCAVRLYKDLSASIAEIKIDLEPQTEHAEVTARLEHGPSHQED
ncbi:Increased DNA methylation 1 [Vigna angularis]|uniref:Increased DNA methylation 1 n=3 Tax=Phaseolus angularis TaxID=3914 RepID=A0A8T0LA07_PHAAN|nr:uncharacterized protein LOC108319864 isoform X1 [Vigna angularis]XP_052734873.1 uncharacterized protein LOC108319864 isoform X1 [Vigna angularis]XP_052734875.1 uncharacterized protein LOC108319864 isoform X1 [Vigna angularis]XP_052734876.1 uncharacterized protein LOC108319864 isoform X1 [Vigna angularis]BAT75808.1 hypothetical protein VIGAN_01373000 [Vigna angularis var. angularis]KAG2408412.1 Increased DNA methylation 1 [Vigna angularis]